MSDCKWNWGHIKDHLMDCPSCGGTGLYDSYEDGTEPCGDCDEGKVRWGSFYTQDNGLCDTCGADDVEIAAMWDDGHEYTCLPCYLKAHRDTCGCALWDKAYADICN